MNKIKLTKIEEIIKTTVLNDSTIGIHGITKANDENIINKMNSIFEYGLRNYCEGGINSNVTVYGNIEEINIEELVNYEYSVNVNPVVNILVAIPYTFKSYNGTEYFIGPFEDTYLGGNSRRIENALKHPFNRWVHESKLFPKELIVGAIIKKEEHLDFLVNPCYVGIVEKDKKQQYFEFLSEELSKYGIKEIDCPDYLIPNTFYGKSLRKIREK